MPLGINRSDPNKGGQSYRNGSPVQTPLVFGNPISDEPSPDSLGNAITSDGKNVNTVDWVPSPDKFGNDIT